MSISRMSNNRNRTSFAVRLIPKINQEGTVAIVVQSTRRNRKRSKGTKKPKVQRINECATFFFSALPKLEADCCLGETGRDGSEVSGRNGGSKGVSAGQSSSLPKEK